MVALDLDGTLLRSDKRISLRVANAVRLAKERGVHVVLATARPPRTTRGIHRALGLDAVQINYNGALILDSRAGRTLLHQPVPARLVEKVVRFVRRIDPRIAVSVEILDKWYADHIGGTLPEPARAEFNPHFVGPMEAFWHKPATKVMLHGSPDSLGRAKAALDAKFGSKLAVNICDSNLVQIVHPEVDKAFALRHVAAHYGIARQNILAIGDALNDVGMIRWAGLGVAMSNGWPQVQAFAKAVVASNDRDGVAEAMERFVL